MTATTIELDTPDGPMPAYESIPEGTPRGAVVVIQEAFGVNEHIESIADRLAAEGYHALAPHIFHRSGGGTASYDDFSKVLPLLEGLTDDGVLSDVDACLDRLHAAGFQDASIGVVGFCLGGRLSLLVALRRRLGAAVTFYGGGIVEAKFPQFPALIDEIPTLGTPWLGLFGDLDTGIPVEHVETLRTAVDAIGTDTGIVRYPDAGHGFNCDVRDSYEPESAADAWARTLIWFGEHLTG